MRVASRRTKFVAQTRRVVDTHVDFLICELRPGVQQGSRSFGSLRRGSVVFWQDWFFMRVLNSKLDRWGMRGGVRSCLKIDRLYRASEGR